jgi:hypothetical protein
MREIHASDWQLRNARKQTMLVLGLDGRMGKVGGLEGSVLKQITGILRRSTTAGIDQGNRILKRCVQMESAWTEMLIHKFNS